MPNLTIKKCQPEAKSASIDKSMGIDPTEMLRLGTAQTRHFYTQHRRGR